MTEEFLRPRAEAGGRAGARETALCRDQKQWNKCEMEQTLLGKKQTPEKMKNQLGISVKAWKWFPFSFDKAVD